MAFNISNIYIKKRNKTLHEKSYFPGDEPVEVNIIFPKEMAEYFDIPYEDETLPDYKRFIE
ncbi:hypothetical protein AA637_07550 [Cyanobacterium sp. HL-69]|uniref:hypothetical protein n=1 Tax=Cyanobacterium sp. HL-69 TaxID=2054282 RepID=UPI000CA2AC0A|nr:hypothetical protein AA637_07550 [Cyanobacterium sp. HL-69]